MIPNVSHGVRYYTCIYIGTQWFIKLLWNINKRERLKNIFEPIDDPKDCMEESA